MTVDVIDAAVHPYPETADLLRRYMPEPWRSRPFPGPFRYMHPAPTGEPPYGEFRAEARRQGALPASLPSMVADQLSGLGVRRAVLLPLTRGLLADVDMGTMVCSATNQWLAETWLESDANAERRWLGSIRINPRDPDAAVHEIERWAGHPSMVQVAVTMESLAPYGQRQFFPIWKVAAEKGLPVAVHADGGTGIDFSTTPNGYPRTYAEYVALYPLTCIYHLTSLIAEGVFERLPDLRFVFADGGQDMLMPLMWRMDVDWPISRVETPWLKQLPTRYLDHVRFCTSRIEGPEDGATLQEWFDMSDAGTLLMYSSNYPHWTTTAADEVLPQLPRDARKRVLHDNAAALYRL